MDTFPIGSDTTCATTKAALTASANISAPLPTNNASPFSMPPGSNGCPGKTVIPARVNACVNSLANRIASFSCMDHTESTRPPYSDKAPAIASTCSNDRCLSARRASSLTLAKLASATACSAVVARSNACAARMLAWATSESARAWSSSDVLTTRRLKKTSPKTAAVTTTPPISAVGGQCQLTKQSTISLPYSITRPIPTQPEYFGRGLT
jgi:hypothetical protein